MMMSLSEIKEYYKIQHDEEDELLERLAVQAQAAAEDYCRVSFEEDTPHAAVLAVMLMIGHFYEHRDNADKQAYLNMRRAFESLLYPYRDPDTIF